MEQADRTRYQLEVEAIQVEDRIYGTLQKMQADPSDEGQYGADLREQVEQLVVNRDKWRAVRLTRVLNELTALNGPPRAQELIKAEIHQLTDPSPAVRETREKRIARRVDEYKLKKGAPGRPPLGRPLQGGGLPPNGSQPATDSRSGHDPTSPASHRRG